MQCLPHVYEALVRSPEPHKLGDTVHTYNPGTWVMKAGGAEVQGHAKLNSELNTRLRYMKMGLT